MRPNYFHPASSSISWQQQQQQERNKGRLVPFPYNHHHHHHHHHHDPHHPLRVCEEGTTFPSSVAGGISSHQPHLDFMSMDSTSSPTNPMNNYHETEQIDDHLVLGRGGGEGSDGRQTMTIEKEHMFDKVVTPSDVGKLNRLVIPKQHAEKHFPLDSSSNEKGLLLNFEDRNGKPWRFRYSYWNSSQSYVMTKGWSRFVKEKKLDAGDIVSFSRGVGELAKDRLFIDWRRRPDAPPLPPPQSSIVPGQYLSFNSWNHHPYYLNHHQYHHQQHQYHQLQHQSNSGSYSYGYSNPCPPPGGSLIYFRSQSPHQQQMVPSAAGGVGIGMMQMQRGGGGGPVIGIDEEEPMVFESVPVVQGKVAAKRLRLFGVNMECPISEPCSDASEPPGIILSSTAVSHHSTASMVANPQPQGSYSGHFSSSSSSSMRPPYNSSYMGAPLLQKMSSSDKMLSKNKGSLSLDFDV